MQHMLSFPSFSVPEQETQLIDGGMEFRGSVRYHTEAPLKLSSHTHLICCIRILIR